MLQRPSSCELCKGHFLHYGFCPDWYPKNPKLAFLCEAPGADEVDQGEPLIGPTGKMTFNRFVRPLGYGRNDVLAANTIRCRPPENMYPTGALAVHMRSKCRQYDDVHGQDLKAGGILTWNPNLFIITEHPACLFRTPAMTRYVEKHIERAFDLAKQGFRVCVVMGNQAMQVVCPELKGGIRAWHGHIWEGKWPGKDEAPKKGFAKLF